MSVNQGRKYRIANTIDKLIDIINILSIETFYNKYRIICYAKKS